MYEKASRGVAQMQKYTRLQHEDQVWSLDLETDPLGPGDNAPPARSPDDKRFNPVVSNPS